MVAAGILTAFEQALHEQRLAVAEHLMRALELLTPDCTPGSPLP